MKHPPNQMIESNVQERGCWSLLFDARNYYEWTKVCRVVVRQAQTLHERIFSCRMDAMPPLQSCNNFLAQNKVKVLEWPENSSDLNSIENL